MIEIKNLKMFDDQKAAREDRFQRRHIVDQIQGIMLNEWLDDYDYRVLINCKSMPNAAALFKSLEKAQAFYNAFKALLPDSPDKMSVIDHKDFE